MASMSDVQGSYTIGCHPSVAIYTLPSILPQLLEKHPGLELKLVHDLSRRIAEQVIRMEIDVGIVVNPVRHPDLVIRKLYDDDVGLWVGPGKHKIQDPRSGHAVLICDPDLLQTQTLLKQLKANEISFSRTLASSNLEVITQLTAAGCGIGVLPDRVAMTASKRGLRRVARGPAFHDEVCVLYRTENRNVRAILTLAEAVAAGKS